MTTPAYNGLSTGQFGNSAFSSLPSMEGGAPVYGSNLGELANRAAEDRASRSNSDELREREERGHWQEEGDRARREEDAQAAADERERSAGLMTPRERTLSGKPRGSQYSGQTWQGQPSEFDERVEQGVSDIAGNIAAGLHVAGTVTGAAANGLRKVTNSRQKRAPDVPSGAQQQPSFEDTLRGGMRAAAGNIEPTGSLGDIMSRIRGGEQQVVRPPMTRMNRDHPLLDNLKPFIPNRPLSTDEGI